MALTRVPVRPEHIVLPQPAAAALKES
jgi:hypothetical protein